MTLRERRELKQLTQVQVAVSVGVSLTTYRLWENGAMNPNEDNRRKLDKVLEVCTDGMDKRSRAIT